MSGLHVHWKVVLSGKGGVGKTTLAALLAHQASRDGYRVVAVDAAPQKDLAFALGIPAEQASVLVPLIRNQRYVTEKMGVESREVKGYSSFHNPDISDVIDRFGIVVRDRLHLLVVGGFEQAPSGCLSPEYELQAQIIHFLGTGEIGLVILDTLTGIEQFGKELTPGFTHAIFVAEPSFRSLQIAEGAASRAIELGIPHLSLVVNKIRSEEDVQIIKRSTTGLTCYEYVFTLPYDDEVHRNETDVSILLDKDTPFRQQVRKIYHALGENTG